MSVLLVMAVWGICALALLDIMFARAVLDIIRKNEALSRACAWIHYLCPDCLPKRELGRSIKLADQGFLPCCDCGKVTSEGIWYRPPGPWQQYPTDFRCADDLAAGF